jgi:acetoin utilization deacetylase AcuC-like enzyme
VEYDPTTVSGRDDVRLFFDPSFTARPRLAWLPGTLGGLSTGAVPEVPGRDLLLRVHSQSLVERVERSRYRELALLSSAVVVGASRDVRNHGGRAIALPAVGGHHAGRGFFGGMCLLNDVAIALSDLRTRGPWRAAVLDTDAHHGDGSLDTLGPSTDTMYVCVCTEGFPPPYPEAFDVRVGPGMSTDAYVAAALGAFVPRVRRFRPDMLIWYMGFDLLEGEYASLGFGTDVIQRLGEGLTSLADEVTGGRLLTVLGGGKDPRRAEEAIGAAVRGLSSPGALADVPGPEPFEAEGTTAEEAVEAGAGRESREWMEMNFGPLGSGGQEVTVGGETLSARGVMDKMGVWAEDLDPIDLITVEEGKRWAVRFFDSEDRRVVLMEFSPDLAILSEARVHVREWMGEDYYQFDWPAGCPWPL